MKTLRSLIKPVPTPNPLVPATGTDYCQVSDLFLESDKRRHHCINPLHWSCGIQFNFAPALFSATDARTELRTNPFPSFSMRLLSCSVHRRYNIICRGFTCAGAVAAKAVKASHAGRHTHLPPWAVMYFSNFLSMPEVAPIIITFFIIPH